MPPSTSRRPRLAAIGAIAAGALLLTACGDQTDDDSEAAGSEAPLFDLLPEDIQQAGEINVGSDVDYAPIEFYNEQDEIDGIDPAIGAALGEVLGVEFTFEDGTFAGLVLGLNNGRHDIVMSAMTDTRERQEGLSEDAGSDGADFVNYFQAGSSILVAKGNPEGIETLDDLCGMTVAAQQGTANEMLVERQQEACDAPIDALIADGDSNSITALQSGRADAVVTDFPVALYNEMTVEDGEAFEVVGEQIDAAPYGIAVNPDNTELRDAIQAAVQEIMDNGTYDEILAEWDAEAGALDEATINAGE